MLEGDARDVADAVVGVRLARSLGERPRPRRDHVVVLGLGRIGQRVVEELVERRIPCIAVERNEAALGARTLAPAIRVVLRLFDHDLAARVESAFGIHVSRSVSSLAAPAFAAALSDRRALATIAVGAQALTVAEFGAPVGRTITELEQAADGEARVLALGNRWAPNADARTERGDTLVAVGSPTGLAALAQS